MCDLDDWFDRRKATIGGAIALGNVGYSAILWPVATDTSEAIAAGYVVLVVLLVVTRHRWQSGAVMAAMLGVTFVGCGD